MKKLLFSILFIFTSFLVSAQEEPKKKESFADEFNREIKSIGKLNYKEYPMTLGIYGGAFFPTTYRDILGIGGDVGIKYKFNFNKFFAISADLGYTYSAGSNGDSNNSNIWTWKGNATSNIFDIRLMGIIQYETKKGESGFAPWIGTGPVISIASTKETIERNFSSFNEITVANYDYTGAGIGYIIAFGFRYNFKKAYVGANFDYTIALPADYDVSGIRLNAEFGYRF